MKILTTTKNLSYEEWLDKTNRIHFCRAMQMRRERKEIRKAISVNDYNNRAESFLKRNWGGAASPLFFLIIIIGYYKTAR